METISVTGKYSAMINSYLGRRLYNARVLRGVGRKQLGNRVGVSYQQIQKYEKGINKISAERLFEFAVILELPIAYFYYNLEMVFDSKKHEVD